MELIGGLGVGEQRLEDPVVDVFGSLLLKERVPLGGLRRRRSKARHRHAAERPRVPTQRR